MANTYILTPDGKMTHQPDGPSPDPDQVGDAAPSEIYLDNPSTPLDGPSVLSGAPNTGGGGSSRDPRLDALAQSAARAARQPGLDQAPSWIFFQFPDPDDPAWNVPRQPGAMIFWPLDPDSLGFSDNDRLVENATVILDVDNMFVGVGLLAAGPEMRFEGPDGRRWWPVMLVDIYDDPRPQPGLLSAMLPFIYGNGVAAPIREPEWAGIQSALSIANVQLSQPIPFNVPSSLALRARGQTLRDGLAGRPDIQPDPATQARLNANGQGDRLPKAFNDRAETRDLLDIGADVSAFARLAVARGIDPPFSIGVFGDWGSGKSFFMDQVGAKIDQIAEQAKDSKHPSHKAYHADVPQIRFNAWHYIESNLWASLVEFIFTELDAWLTRQSASPTEVGALFDKLSTSRQLKLEAFRDLLQARREKKKADDKVASANDVYQKALKRPLSAADGPRPPRRSSAG